MNAQDLKNSILQLAMQGKLVPQNPNDEPASVLLNNLNINRTSIIYKENNHYFERVGKKEPVCIDEVIPFDIPDSWEMCRLGDFCNLNGGYAFKSTEFQDSGIRVIRISDFDENGFKNDKIVYYENNDNLDKYVLEDDDIIMAMTGGTVGKTFHVKGLTEKMYVNQRVADIKVIEGIDTDYIYSILQSAFIKGIIHKNKNSTNDNISMKTIKSFIIPIPPINEQYRIVNKIKELMGHINDYDDLKISWDVLNSSFPAKLKSSILQEAVQGKLVPQDLNDEPASVLLENIKQEKEQLIKAKKIKKNNKESVIYKENGHYYEKIGKKEPVCIDDELPFDIPDSWRWCRLENIVELINGDRGKNYPAKSKLSTVSGIPFISAINLSPTGIKQDNLYYLSQEQYDLLSRGKLKKNDLIFCLRGSLGKNSIFDLDKGAIASSLVILRRYTDDIFLKYLFYYINSSATSNEIRKYDNGTAQPNLAASSLKKFFVPIPPLNEQKRIVAKVDQLFENVDVLIVE